MIKGTLWAKSGYWGVEGILWMWYHVSDGKSYRVKKMELWILARAITSWGHKELDMI